MEIDFNDFAPPLVGTPWVMEGGVQKRSLVRDPLFNVEAWQLAEGTSGALAAKTLQIVAVTGGEVNLRSGGTEVRLAAGQFALVPASLEATQISADGAAALLRVEAR